MSIEIHLEMGMNDVDMVLERLKKSGNVIEPAAKIAGVVANTIRNDSIIATIMKMSDMVSSFRKEDYGVDVEYALIFKYNTLNGVNSGDNILFFIRDVVKCSRGDFLILPDGNEPIVIRRNGEIILMDTFGKYLNNDLRYLFMP